MPNVSRPPNGRRKDERASKRTLLLWWEGLPSVIRGDVWRLAIGDPLGLGAAAFDAQCVKISGEDDAMALQLVSRELQVAVT